MAKMATTSALPETVSLSDLRSIFGGVVPSYIYTLEKEGGREGGARRLQLCEHSELHQMVAQRPRRPPGVEPRQNWVGGRACADGANGSCRARGPDARRRGCAIDLW